MSSTPDSYSIRQETDKELRLFDDALLSENRLPDYHHELRHHSFGRMNIAGIDEAGRGPLAGPVVAAAVILDPNHIPQGLNDSKKLAEEQRLELFEEISQTASIAWAASSAKEIDQINIRQATLRAMTSASRHLPISPDHVLVDGRDVPLPLHANGTALVKGDAISVSIAAASIVAKVIRDKIMQANAVQFPQYGFERHKGYGSAGHLKAIAENGPCRLHRMSFSPMREGK